MPKPVSYIIICFIQCCSFSRQINHLRPDHTEKWEKGSQLSGSPFKVIQIIVCALYALSKVKWPKTISITDTPCSRKNFSEPVVQSKSLRNHFVIENLYCQTNALLFSCGYRMPAIQIVFNLLPFTQSLTRRLIIT